MNNFLLMGGIGTKILHEIIFLIDTLIYSIAKVAFQVFCYVSEATILHENDIQRFTQRIYAIVGIIMVFVIAYNLLNYIINPDKISDKQVGASTMIKDIVIALVVMGIIPLIFTKLYSFQNIIINSGVISNLVIGGYRVNGEEVDGREFIKNGANNAIVNVFSAFIVPKDDSFSSLDCLDEDAMISYNNGEMTIPAPEWLSSSESGEWGEYCTAYSDAVKDGNLGHFQSIILDDGTYDYYILLSTAAGVVLTFFMLSFCVNLGKRVGKMAILQLLAPVPLLMEIIPGKKGTRKNWIDTLIKTYLEVFVFQAVVFLVVFLITLIPGTVKALFANAEGAGLVRVFTLIFLIFGLFQFGKEAPKMISNLLGLKDDGTIGQVAKRALAMGSVAGNTLGSVVSNTTRNVVNTQGVGKKILSGVGGAFSAGARNLWAGRNAHSWRDAANNRRTVNGTVQANRVNRRDYFEQNNGGATGFQGLRNVVHARINDVGGNITDRVTNWAQDSYSEGNTRLKAYKQYTDIFNGTKISTSSDDRYMNFRTQMDDILRRNGLTSNQFDEFRNRSSAWLRSNPGMTLNDYFSSSDYSSLLSTSPHFLSVSNADLKDMTNLSNSMNNREDALILDKKNDIIMALSKARVLAENDRTIEAALRSEGINLNALPDLQRTGVQDADFILVYNTLKKANKSIKSAAASITADIASQEYERQLRNERRNNNSGGNGNH